MHPVSRYVLYGLAAASGLAGLIGFVLAPDGGRDGWLVLIVVGGAGFVWTRQRPHARD